MMAARMFLIATQTINVALAAVGAVGVGVTIVQFFRFLETVPIPGLLPGASGPGAFFAVMGGLTITLLATIAFIALWKGRWWAFWLSVPLWIVVWMLAIILPFFFIRLIPGMFGKHIAGIPELLILTAVCAAGIGIALTTFFLARGKVATPQVRIGSVR